MSGTHNIGACIKSLVVAALLLLVVGPVLELNGGVGAGSDRAGKGANLVALVARFDLGHVADNLLGKVALLVGVYVVVLSVEATLTMVVSLRTVVKRNIKGDLPCVVGDGQSHFSLAYATIRQQSIFR